MCLYYYLTHWDIVLMPRALQTEAREVLLVLVNVLTFTFVARASSRARQHLYVWVMASHQKHLMKG